jgi:hypothetical protein
MAVHRNGIKWFFDTPKKKTRQGKGKFSKFGNKGGGPGGSATSKLYRKRPRGQGK